MLQHKLFLILNERLAVSEFRPEIGHYSLVWNGDHFAPFKTQPFVLFRPRRSVNLANTLDREAECVTIQPVAANSIASLNIYVFFNPLAYTISTNFAPCNKTVQPCSRTGAKCILFVT